MIDQKNFSYPAFCIGLALLAVAVVLLVTVLTGPKETAEETEAAAETTVRTTAVTGTANAEERTRRSGFQTILIAGTDSDGTRTDTILLAALDTEAGTLSLLSIPRDTRAYMADGSIHKINAAHNKGIDRMLTEIENTVGFAPEHYLILDYEVFSMVIDAVGGVTVDVGMDMDYSDPTQGLEIHLKAGEQTLNGEEALQYMRFRSGYADADLGRIRAQQKLFTALAQKLKTLRVLGIVPIIPQIMRQTETDLSATDMLGLVLKIIKLSETALTVDTLPGKPLGADYDASRSGVLALINERYNPYEEPITQVNIP